jgi:hypothetical protein
MFQFWAIIFPCCENGQKGLRRKESSLVFRLYWMRAGEILAQFAHDSSVTLKIGNAEALL